MTKESGTPKCGTNHADQCLDRGTLAGTIRPEESKDLPCRYSQIHLVQGLNMPTFFAAERF
ncbi:MAG: hypothetical protein A2005_05050 [Desulfuromonadales bacterium GWC2_61_20]|nr:MAG: hypothetical protein A2005_05050 [Desulfuromonadales bacterium GWC2_61_20]